MVLRNYISLLLLFFVAACNFTSTRQNPKFLELPEKQYSVAVLLPQIEVVILDAKNTAIPRKQERVRELMQYQLPQLLQTRGYKAIEFDAKKLEKEMAALSAELYKNLGDMYQLDRVQYEESIKFEKSVGKLANPFAKETGADLLLFSRYRGTEKTKDARQMDALVGVASLITGFSPDHDMPENGAFVLILIDAKTGDILWTDIQVAHELPTNYKDYPAKRKKPIAETSFMRHLFEHLPNKSEKLKTN